MSQTLEGIRIPDRGYVCRKDWLASFEDEHDVSALGLSFGDLAVNLSHFRQDQFAICIAFDVEAVDPLGQSFSGCGVYPVPSERLGRNRDGQALDLFTILVTDNQLDIVGDRRRVRRNGNG